MKLLNSLIALLLCFYSFAQPANDNPCSAISLTANASCTYSVYTNAAATASAGVPAPGCASYSGGDVWFSLVVPAGGTVTVDMNTGVITDSGLAFYTGTCGSLTLLSCDDDASLNGNMSMLTATGLTVGSTLFIRVWEYGNNNNGTFSICATAPAPPPVMTNDDPCTAISLTAGASCTYVTGTTVGSTNTAGVPAPGCASYSGPDVWYSVVVPASGTVIMNSNTGTTTDGGMAIYTGTCGSLSLLSCDDDSSPNGAMPMLTAGGLTPGSTIYVRMWDFGGGTGTFSICATAGAPTGPCGLAATNDNCPSPAILTQGPGTFSATTDVTFTSDQPGNVGTVFCGSIENNSWYQFTASATTENFPITYVGGCVSGYGIQAHVYSVTYTAGCCTGFTSVSNCYNPGNTTLGTVTATGLTIGNQYLLMIDGNAGDGCEFTISGWTATGILPVEIISFNGVNEENGVLLTWKTLSEVNNDYFEILHSRDGLNFTSIGTVNGAGTSTDKHEYGFKDEKAQSGINYYQLRQFDFDGKQTSVEQIAINREINSNGIVNVYPNPTSSHSTMQFNCERSEETLLLITDQTGHIILNEMIQLEKGVTNYTINTDQWSKGVYQVIAKSNSFNNHIKITKTL
jgi:Secretion system C-terminal sorting domain